jgi:hypothetical protein
MKKTQILALIACSILIAAGGIADAGEKILVNEKLPLPDDVMMAAPAADIPKAIAAFSGVWEGKESNYGAKVFLIVEEINSKEAKAIYCRAEVAAAHMPAVCDRYKAIVTPEKQQIEFGLDEKHLSTFIMGNSLTQAKGTINNPGFSYKIIMNKIK